MRALSHLTILSLLIPALELWLPAQSGGGRAVQSRGNISRAQVRGRAWISPSSSRFNSLLTLRTRQNQANNPVTQVENGNNHVKNKIRVTSRLPKRVFAKGPWLPGQRQTGVGLPPQQGPVICFPAPPGAPQQGQTNPPPTGGQQMPPAQQGAQVQALGNVAQQTGQMQQQIGNSRPAPQQGAQIQALGNVTQQTGQMQQQTP